MEPFYYFSFAQVQLSFNEGGTTSITDINANVIEARNFEEAKSIVKKLLKSLDKIRFKYFVIQEDENILFCRINTTEGKEEQLFALKNTEPQTYTVNKEILT